MSATWRGRFANFLEKYQASENFCRQAAGNFGGRGPPVSILSDPLEALLRPDRKRPVADAACPLRVYIMTPYRDHGHMIAEEKRFSYSLSRKRVRVENALGVLKNRIRELLLLEFHAPEWLRKFILACCVLRNICIWRTGYEC